MQWAINFAPYTRDTRGPRVGDYIPILSAIICCSPSASRFETQLH